MNEREVRRRLADLERLGHSPEKFICLLANRSLSAIYWIFALLLANKKFAIAHAANWQQDEKYFQSALGKFHAIDAEAALPDVSCEALPAIDISPEPRLVLFSSGTTGQRRAIAISLENLKASAHAHENHLRQRRDDVWLASLPFHHIGGLSVLSRALLLEQDIAFEKDLSLESLLNWMESGRLTGISLVPTLLYRIIASLKQATRTLEAPRLRHALIGGDHAAKELLLEAQNLGIPALATYGLTEASSQLATQQELARPGLFLLPKTEARLAGDGELEIRGPSVVLGEYENGKYLARPSDWLPTGDLAELHPDANSLVMLGRKKELVVSGGVKIIPREVEEIFSRLTRIESCAFIGVPDSEWGEKGILVYESPQALPKEIFHELKLQLGPIKNPKSFMHWDEIPRNQLGKISRADVRRRYLSTADIRSSFSES